MRNKDVAYIGLYLAIGTALGGFLFSQTTRQRTKELTHGDKKTAKRAIEIRDYDTAIVAQVEVEGSRIEAVSRGFRILADFIGGQNTESHKIAMTTPVIQQDSEQIEMAAPVMHHGEGLKWTVQFVMPDEYTLDNLPQPTNPLIAIREIPARQMAVIRFHGSNKNAPLIAAKIAELEAYIADESLNAHGAPVLAFYDPPWTIPFLRRNEVMIELKTAAQLAEKPTINEEPRPITKPKLAKKG